MMYLVNESNSLEVEISDHRPFIAQLESNLRGEHTFQGLNTFNYWALPDLPRGTFLISRKEWERAGFGATGITVRIEDQNTTVSFLHCVVDKLEYVQAPLTSLTTTPDYKDFLIVSLVKPMYGGYKDTAAIYLYTEGETYLTDLFTVVNGTDPGVALNLQVIGDELPLNKVYGYVANTLMMTAYVDRASSSSDKVSIVGLNSGTGTLLPLYKRMAYSKVSISTEIGKVQLLIQRKDIKNTVTTVASSVDTVSYTESVVRNPLTNSNNFTYAYVYPFYQTNADTFAGDATNTTIFNAVKANASYRLGRSYKLVFLGVVDANISNDCQRITYTLDNLGITTTVESVPWAYFNPSGFPKPVICTERVVTFTLRSEWYGGIAIADFTDPLDANFVGYTGVVEDPQGIFTYLHTNQQGYAIIKCNNRALAIQAKCGSVSTSSSSATYGRCCMTERVYPYDVYCIPDTLASYCVDNDNYTAAWTAGASCPCP